MGGEWEWEGTGVEGGRRGREQETKAKQWKGGQREWGSRRRREGGGQREEARITSYEQVGIIVSRMMLGMSTPQRVLHTV